jgi:DNA-binding HxlR family transcriptional regulator
VTRDARSPTAALFDLLGRRWALRVLWELRDNPAPFQELQARCDGMSTSVLAQRLSELRDAGLVEKRDDGYRLSERGAGLMARLDFVEELTSTWGQALERVGRQRQATGGGKR